MCGEKRQYPSKEAAYAQIAYIFRSSANGVRNLRAYKCGKCKKYHLTSEK